MYPFFSEGQRLVHEQMVQEAMTRERIRVELNGKRAERGWIGRIIRPLGRSPLSRNQPQSGCDGLQLSACNTDCLAAGANKSDRTKFGSSLYT